MGLSKEKFTEFEFLAESLPIAIYLLGRDGYFKYVNKKNV